MKRAVTFFSIFLASCNVVDKYNSFNVPKPVLRFYSHRLTGEPYTFEKGEMVNFIVKTPDVLKIYAQGGIVKEEYQDYNSDGKMGNVPEDMFIETFADGSKRILSRNSVVINGIEFRYQGPNYAASPQEQKIIEDGRRELEGALTLRFQNFKSDFFARQ